MLNSKGNRGRYFVLVFTVWLLPFYLIAQKGSFEVAVSGGATIYQGDVSKEGFGSLRGKDGVFGAKASYEFSDYWALEASFHKGMISGADSFYLNDEFRAQRRFQFHTDFKDFALKAKFSPLSHLRLHPHASVGLGLVVFEPNAFMLDNSHLELVDLIKQDFETDFLTKSLLIPIELGASYTINDRFGLTGGLQFNFVMTDYLDGISWAGNSNDKDRYGQIYLGAKFRFNRVKDIDGDEIPDLEDECPLKPGLKATNGCPDTDLDGIRDSEDRCPYAAGTVKMLGCPDTDKDGTADPFDRCPAKAGPPEALGCPSVDSDHDGIEDHLDECPLKKGPPERNGCPAIDSDLDGILDEDDECPSLFGLPIFNGCPDMDGDGIEDIKDACPSLFGLFAEQGCPLFANKEEEVYVLSRQKIHFEANGSSITNFVLLDRIAEFMFKNPSYKLSIRAFADPLGSDETTDYISQLRAEKVYQYIAAQNISIDRLEAEGLGIQQIVSSIPGLTNQLRNRRVEFTLFK